MSKKLFTNDEILSLSKNRYVKRVSEKGITYTDEFKSLFIEERSIGKLTIQIFQDAGFDVVVLNSIRINCASARWN